MSKMCKTKRLWILISVTLLFSSNIYALKVVPTSVVKEVKAQTIRLGDVFEHVTGVKEALGIKFDFRQGDDGFYYIENAKNEKRFCCGKVDYTSLDALKKKDSQVVAYDKADRKPSFKVICYTREHPENFYQADVCALQAAPENKDAVFQLASRFHGLEGGCVYGGEFGMGFDHMLHGPAQGEYASFSAAQEPFIKFMVMSQ